MVPARRFAVSVYVWTVGILYCAGVVHPGDGGSTKTKKVQLARAASRPKFQTTVAWSVNVERSVQQSRNGDGARCGSQEGERKPIFQDLPPSSRKRKDRKYSLRCTSDKRIKYRNSNAERCAESRSGAQINIFEPRIQKGNSA